MNEPGMPPPREVTLDGVTYKIWALDAYSALPVWHRVARVLAATASTMGDSGAALKRLTVLVDGETDGGMGELAIAAKLATAGAAAALKEFEPTDLRLCIDAFAAKTEVTMPDGKTPSLAKVFPTHFAGRYTSMLKWFAACLEVNFGDFLEQGRAMWNSAKLAARANDGAKSAAATSPSESPAASTGSSGA